MTLKAKPVEGRLVADVDAMEANIKRYLGHELNASGQWELIDAILELDDCEPYRKAIRQGDLMPVIEPQPQEPIMKSSIRAKGGKVE